MQLRLRFLPAALLFVGAAHFAAAQSAPGTVPLNPNATCPYPTSDQVVACLAQVEADEASRSGGPCSDGEWDCICNKQQGLIACWAPCYEAQPADQVNYNNANCNGQHGVTNAAAANGNGVQYSGSPLTTSASLTGSVGPTPTASGASSATDSSAATASDPASSSSVQGSPSASSVSASAASASSSTTPNGATVHRLPGLQEAGALAAAAVGILLFA